MKSRNVELCSPRFPWDADIDANFIASHPVVIGSLLEEHEETLTRMGSSVMSKLFHPGSEGFHMLDSLIII